jgi:hypothetical protein
MAKERGQILNFEFWIVDFGFWIGKISSGFIQNSEFKIALRRS